MATRNYTFQFDATSWGWIHLLLGLLVAFAGYGLLSGKTWARLLAITLAALSATANFLFIPYYPFWSLLDRHPEHLRDLGDHRPRPRHARPGLTEA